MEKNVILKDDNIIGYTEDVMNYLKSEIKRLLFNNGKVVEEELDAMKNMLELIVNIKNNFYGLIKVYSHPMGDYMVESLED